MPVWGEDAEAVAAREKRADEDTPTSLVLVDKTTSVPSSNRVGGRLNSERISFDSGTKEVDLLLLLPTPSKCRHKLSKASRTASSAVRTLASTPQTLLLDAAAADDEDDIVEEKEDADLSISSKRERERERDITAQYSINPTAEFHQKKSATKIIEVRIDP